MPAHDITVHAEFSALRTVKVSSGIQMGTVYIASNVLQTTTSADIEKDGLQELQACKDNEITAVAVARNDNYSLKKIYYVAEGVDGAESKETVIDPDQNGDFKFTMPDADVTVYAEFEYNGKAYKVSVGFDNDERTEAGHLFRGAVLPDMDAEDYISVSILDDETSGGSGSGGSTSGDSSSGGSGTAQAHEGQTVIVAVKDMGSGSYYTGYGAIRYKYKYNNKEITGIADISECDAEGKPLDESEMQEALCTLECADEGKTHYYTFAMPDSDVDVCVRYTKTDEWDGLTIDVSWFDPEEDEYHITTGAQLMGLAALVNGIYNDEIDVVIGDDTSKTLKKISDGESGRGTGKSFIIDHKVIQELDPTSSNKVSSDVYHYGEYTFKDKYVYIDNDLDMGGEDQYARYMPIGGQYLMNYEDIEENIGIGDTHLSSSFSGVLDGLGHTIYNVWCDRYVAGENYGDSQSIGIVGRLGVHENDDEDEWPTNPTVRNIILGTKSATGTGTYDDADSKIRGRRSVGGIVGKAGKANGIGAIIENCINRASIWATDKQGTGGIVGASENGGYIANCANFGNVENTLTDAAGMAGGITGRNENDILGCYSVGKVEKPSAYRSSAMAIGTNNLGSPSIAHTYYLAGSALGGGYFKSTSNGDILQENARTSQKMKSTDFVNELNFIGEVWYSASEIDSSEIGNGGYPILFYQTDDQSKQCTSKVKITVKQPEGGTVTAETLYGAMEEVGKSKKVACGTTVKLSSTAEPGRILDCYMVDGEKISGDMAFITKDTEISAVFRSITPVKLYLPETPDNFPSQYYYLTVRKNGSELMDDGTFVKVESKTVPSDVTSELAMDEYLYPYAYIINDKDQGASVTAGGEVSYDTENGGSIHTDEWGKYIIVYEGDNLQFRAQLKSTSLNTGTQHLVNSFTFTVKYYSSQRDKGGTDTATESTGADSTVNVGGKYAPKSDSVWGLLTVSLKEGIRHWISDPVVWDETGSITGTPGARISGYYDISWYKVDSEGNSLYDSYDISTPYQLAGVSYLSNWGLKYTDSSGIEKQTTVDFEGITLNLTADISLENPDAEGAMGTCYWVPIGIDSDPKYNLSQYYDTSTSKLNYKFGERKYASPFRGTFEGNDHTVYLSTYYSVDGIDTTKVGMSSVKGLFGFVEGTVKNVTIDAAKGPVAAGDADGVYIGTVAGCLVSGEITGCKNNLPVVPKDTEKKGGIGGIVGGMVGGTISDCENNAKIGKFTRSIRCGGIVGYQIGGTVSNCTNNGTIFASAADDFSGLSVSYAGGIIGYQDGSMKKTDDIGDIDGCKNYGNVNAEGCYVGGIVGYTTAKITNCENHADIGLNEDVSASEKDSDSDGDGKDSGAYLDAKASYIGGIGGYIKQKDTGTQTEVKNNKNYGKIQGSEYVGGIGGRIGGNVEECENMKGADVTGVQYVGGIGGKVEGISSCKNYADVKAVDGYVNKEIHAPQFVGGAGGYVASRSDKATSMSGCSNYGTVTVSSNLSTDPKNVYEIDRDYSDKDGFKVFITKYAEKNTSVSLAVGGLAGYLRGSLSDCENHGNVDAKSSSSVGGVTGAGSQFDISNIKNFGQVDGGPCTAGIAGSVELLTGGTGTTGKNGQMKSCINLSSAAITGEDYTGGLIGYVITQNSNGINVILTNNYGDVSGGDYVGGLIGCMADSELGTNMSDAYIGSEDGTCNNGGNITGGSYVGGIIGMMGRGNMRYCLNLGESDNVKVDSYSTTYENTDGATVVNASSSSGSIAIATVTGKNDDGKVEYVGGIVGWLKGGTSDGSAGGNSFMYNCGNCGAVECHGSDVDYVGGVAGKVQGNIYLSRSREGTIDAPSAKHKGEVAGEVTGDTSYCYSTSEVKSSSGDETYLVGKSGGAMSYCYTTGSNLAPGDEKAAVSLIKCYSGVTSATVSDVLSNLMVDFKKDLTPTIKDKNKKVYAEGTFISDDVEINNGLPILSWEGKMYTTITFYDYTGSTVLGSVKGAKGSISTTEIPRGNEPPQKAADDEYTYSWAWAGWSKSPQTDTSVTPATVNPASVEGVASLYSVWKLVKTPKDQNVPEDDTKKKHETKPNINPSPTPTPDPTPSVDPDDRKDTTDTDDKGKNNGDGHGDGHGTNPDGRGNGNGTGNGTGDGNGNGNGTGNGIGNGTGTGGSGSSAGGGAIGSGSTSSGSGGDSNISRKQSNDGETAEETTRVGVSDKISSLKSKTTKLMEIDDPSGGGSGGSDSKKASTEDAKKWIRIIFILTIIFLIGGAVQRYIRFKRDTKVLS